MASPSARSSGYASSRYGRAGLELAYDAELSGLGGDPVSDALRKFGTDPYDPKDLTLSLSLELQRAAVRALGDRKGAVVMLDPRNGEVLAMASTPTYSASALADPATADRTFKALQEDEDEPLLPRATLGRYVPGSVFKIVTAIAGLGSGAVTPRTTYAEQPGAEEDGLVVDGFRIRDGHHLFTGSERLDLVGATQVSCNIWYALTGLETGGGDLVDYAGAPGLRGAAAIRPADRDLAGHEWERRRPGWLRRRRRAGQRRLRPGRDVRDAPPDGARGKHRRERRGAAPPPARDGDDGRARDAEDRRGHHRRVIDGGDAAAINEAMVAAVETERGQQYTSGAKIPGVTTAGKSGTAELGGRGEPHSWFIGFAPAEAPRVAIAVLVEEAGRGAEVAAPMAGNLMERWLDSSE